jgi:hypothetical protein
MRNRRDLALVAGTLFAVLLLAVFLGPTGSGDDGDPRLSTYLSGRDGSRALFLALAELGIPAERRLEPWDEGLAGEAGPAGLVVLAPPRPSTPREMEALLDWVRAGGTLVYGPGGGADRIGDELGLPTRSAAPEAVGALERVRWMERRAEGIAARPTAPHPWTDGVEEVIGFHRVFRAGLPGAEGARVLLATEDGDPAVVLLRLGEGRVVAWSDPWVLSNGRLREGDGALLFARLAAELAVEGAPIRFDEYHQGFRADGGPVLALRRFLLETGAGRWLLQAGVAALALLLLAGARLGAPLPETSTRRRSPLEHVEAVSAAYRKAGARDTARRLLIAGLDRRLGRRWSRMVDAAPSGAEASPAIRRIREATNEEGEKDLVALAAAVDEFVREVRGWTRAR